MTTERPSVRENQKIRPHLVGGYELSAPMCYIEEAVKKLGSVAQWLEQGTHKPKVAGSNPA